MTRMTTMLLGAVLVSLVAAAPARAQDDRVVHFTIGGGVTPVLGAVSDRFDTGGGFDVGVWIQPPATPMFAMHVEYSFNGLGGHDRTIGLQATPFDPITTNGLIESHHDVHVFTFNGILQVPGTGRFRPYLSGGSGVYYRTVSLTTPDVGFTTVCDPYWYVCYPTAVEVDRVIGDRSSWDPGVNLGGGVAIGLNEHASFYVEAKWHYVWGPKFTDLQGVTQQANGQYFPVTFGFRF
jgi:opacity protein-like surface antigen